MDAIAVLNAGSSSIKFSLFTASGNKLELVAREQDLVALVLADSMGVLLAANRAGPEAEELAAVAPIAVAVVESQTVVREGLRVLIDGQADMQTVAEASSLRSAVALDVAPRVVLTTLDLPDAHGDDIVAGLRRRFPGASVFVLSAVDHPAFVQQVLASDPTRGYTRRYGSDAGPWTTRDFVEAVYKSLQAQARSVRKS